MNLTSLQDLEHGLGGRPKLDSTMVRMTFYLPEIEARKLKEVANQNGQPISQILREQVRSLLSR